MRSKRAEFSPETKIACFKRDKGKCRICTKPIVTAARYYHFPVPAELDRLADLDNCRLLCIVCYDKQTRHLPLHKRFEGTVERR